MEQDISNGNRNDFHWKNKIEDIDHLPDAVLTNKNAAWEKLHNRLHEKKGIQPFWYWLAAACLLFVIVVPVITGSKKQNSIVKNTNEKAPSKKQTIAAMPSSKEDTMVDVSTPANENKSIRQSIRINEKNSSKNSLVIKEEPLYSALNDRTDITNEPVVLPAATDSAAVNTPAVVRVKKKLRVVHINELEPFAETPNIARRYEQHSFQLKLINLESNTGISLPSESRGFTLFKTTKASSN